MGVVNLLLNDTKFAPLDSPPGKTGGFFLFARNTEHYHISDNNRVRIRFHRLRTAGLTRTPRGPSFICVIRDYDLFLADSDTGNKGLQQASAEDGVVLIS